MKRNLILGIVVAAVAMAAAVPVLAQQRQDPARTVDNGEKAALAEHKAQEERERAAAQERAKRREAARTGQDPRKKDAPRQEEEEETGKRDPG